MADELPPADGDAGITFGTIEPIEIQEEMEQSFLDYAMSVIVSRALPDVRDGLKPVHRRILWAMYDAGLRPDRRHVKCATVVGDVIGRYHPHGDQAAYDSLVRMGQGFSLRHTLIDPHGNFGSPSDPPAAYRYTECRLTSLAMRLLADIDEDTVDFAANFDGRFEEPEVLPARFPNFLVNGSQGIAVGMATNVPPHNLGEVIDATIHLIDNPDSAAEALMEFVKGPDFPTGGQIMGRSGIADAYLTGRGSIKLRSVAEIEESGRTPRIVVTEIPYQASVEQIEQKAAELVDRRELEGVKDIRNESAQGNTRLVFELKKDAPALVILNNLYKHTPLQTNFPINMVALVDGVPRVLNLRDSIASYVSHQTEVLTRRSEFRLEKARSRAHIVEGLIKAISLIDEIIVTIRASANRSVAREALMGEPFEFTERQATEILDMQLGRLTRLGHEELEKELSDLRQAIAELEAILADESRLRALMKDELVALKEEFSEARRTTVTIDPGDLDIEDLIDDEDLVVVMSANGYIKTVSIDAFRTQARGGRGVTGATLRGEDYVRDIIHTTAHAYLLFFSNRGKVYRVKAHEIPMANRTARGTAIVNLLQLQPEERIQAIIDTRDYETNRFLFFATKLGQVKKTRFNEYDSSRRDGLIAINLREDDELVRVIPTNGDDDIVLVSQKGQGIRFSEEDVRPMGRSAAGVRGMKLRGGDVVVGCDAVRAEMSLLTITDGGYGKRTPVEQFGTQHRGGQGVRAMRIHEGKGRGVVSGFTVGTDDEIFVIASGGVIIRMSVGDISQQGRDATGVRVMNLEPEQQVAAVARVLQGDEEV
ncbi:MAG: DNA gyrase subunit A [Acidimicrobiales bacterium]|nr:MAG: DNA gyrase subunit A [Actinomycetota bacterium]MBV6509761.1 DNA gyrase subunit A [Acidimicrobiales bacterium]RIK04845.1 MAG: DNA gyrase subunit A [Acidobacteriota bacterium]